MSQKHRINMIDDSIIPSPNIPKTRQIKVWDILVRVTHWTIAAGIIAYTLFWLAVVFAAFHTGVLLADNFLNLNLWQVLLPFFFQTERIGVALGQLGFWLLFICAFSFYIKKYIGQSA